MSYKGFLSGVFAGTIAAAGALIFVILSLSPDKGILSLIAFFGSLFVFLSGLFTIIGFYVRRAFKGSEILYASVPASFRQGVLISIFVTVVLALNSFKILVLWDAILLFFSIMLLEFYFRTKIN